VVEPAGKGELGAEGAGDRADRFRARPEHGTGDLALAPPVGFDPAAEGGGAGAAAGEPGDLRLLLVGGRSCVDHRTWTPGLPQQGSGSSCPPGVLRPTHASVLTHPSSLCNLLHKLISGSLEVDPEDT